MRDFASQFRLWLRLRRTGRFFNVKPKQKGFIGGLQVYAALGCLVVVLGLVGWGLYQKNRATQAEARVHEVTGQRDRAIAAARANEEAIKRLGVLNDALNAAIVERDKRAQALEAAKRQLKSEIDALKSQLPAEDQSCLDRDLPGPLVERLRL